jgi:hypothetical protein
MYIEFWLPSGAGGMAAAHAIKLIKKEIEAWASKYNVTYRTKAVKYTFRLSFNDERDYVHFQLSWNPDNHVAKRYTIVEPGQIN